MFIYNNKKSIIENVGFNLKNQKEFNKQSILRDYLFLNILHRNNPENLIKLRQNLKKILSNLKLNKKNKKRIDRLNSWVMLIDERILG